MTITESAVAQRIRHKVRKTGDGTHIHWYLTTLGVHILIVIDNNLTLPFRRDLEAYARELGVLQPHESVAE